MQCHLSHQPEIMNETSTCTCTYMHMEAYILTNKLYMNEPLVHLNQK